MPGHSHIAIRTPPPSRFQLAASIGVCYLLPEKLDIWPCDSGVCSTGMMALKDWSYLLPPQVSLVPAGSSALQRSGRAKHTWLLQRFRISALPEPFDGLGVQEQPTLKALDAHNSPTACW